jgi:diguanylate cyclase (GGDEF)-like protein
MTRAPDASIARSQTGSEVADWRARFLEEVPAALALFDPEGRYVAMSPAWATAFDLPPSGVAGRRHDEFGKTGAAALDEVRRLVLAGRSVEHYGGSGGDDRVPRGWRPVFSARPHRGAGGAIVGVVVALRSNHPSTAADAAQPLPDPLTGLAERHEFARRLRRILAQADPEHRAVAVFAINLNRFRNINTLHGVRTGDQVLRVTADRLVAGTRARRPGEDGAAPRRGRDFVARLGNDEFGVVCGPPGPATADAEALAQRLLGIVQSPIAIGEASLRLTASIGFVTTTAAHADENEVLRDLDLALQRAKALGPGKISAWEPSLTRIATRRYSLTDQLRRAFDDGEFVLHYQPVVRLSDQRMVGAEALLRWRRPSEGLLAPAAFLHVLEETGLIVEVGCWVIREAVRQIEAWHVLYGRDMIDWVSVNVSPRQFDDPAPLLATLREIHEGGFAVGRLKLEITETTFMRNPEVTRAVLAEIEELGIRIGIDDFGTGYSSLGALRRYPVDTIKIDAEFIAQIGTGHGDELAQALLNIARMYGAAIVAEGIETAAQLEFLREGGCGFGQGYLFGEPMDAALLGSRALIDTMKAPAQPARRAG